MEAGNLQAGYQMLLAKILFTSFLVLASAPPTQVHSLSGEQLKSFRSWLVTIVEDQISRGANPRWQHQDCAGLVRFAVKEALARHDFKWRKANGFIGRPLPAEVEMDPKQRQLFKTWKNSDGETSHFIRALPLIQQNTVFLGKTTERLEPGDLLFFDQGEDQHLMVWTGRRIVYHNGQKPKKQDNGLRAVSLNDLLKWNDCRWQPRPENPNFIGFYRLAFLYPKIQEGDHE